MNTITENGNTRNMNLVAVPTNDTMAANYLHLSCAQEEIIEYMGLDINNDADCDAADRIASQFSRALSRMDKSINIGTVSTNSSKWLLAGYLV